MNAWLLGAPYINMWFWEGRSRLDELKVKALGGWWLTTKLWHLPVPPPLHIVSCKSSWAFRRWTPGALMLPWYVTHLMVIVHWHLGNWKCFSWMWVTPGTELHPPPLSAPPSLLLCEPDCDMWHVAPRWGSEHWSGWLMLPHIGNSAGLSRWTVNRHSAFRGRKLSTC